MKRPLLLFFPQMCVKPRKLNVSGFPSPRRASVLGRERSELQQPRLLGMQFQLELPNSSPRAPPGTVRHPLGVEIPPRCRPQIARRSHRRAPASDATLGPTGRTRNEDRRSPAAAMHCRPGASLPPLHVRFPSSSTPAFSHFWMSRTTRRSAIRCSTNFTSHSWAIASKKPRMSRSSTQFTFFVSSPT